MGVSDKDLGGDSNFCTRRVSLKQIQHAVGSVNPTVCE